MGEHDTQQLTYSKTMTQSDRKCQEHLYGLRALPEGCGGKTASYKGEKVPLSLWMLVRKDWEVGPTDLFPREFSMLMCLWRWQASWGTAWWVWSLARFQAINKKGRSIKTHTSNPTQQSITSHLSSVHRLESMSQDTNCILLLLGNDHGRNHTIWLLICSAEPWNQKAPGNGELSILRKPEVSWSAICAHILLKEQ